MGRPTKDDYNRFNVAADEFAFAQWEFFINRVDIRKRLIGEMPLITANQINSVMALCKDVYCAGIAQGAESALVLQRIGKGILDDTKKAD